MAILSTERKVPYLGRQAVDICVYYRGKGEVGKRQSISVIFPGSRLYQTEDGIPAVIVARKEEFESFRTEIANGKISHIDVSPLNSKDPDMVRKLPHEKGVIFRFTPTDSPNSVEIHFTPQVEPGIKHGEKIGRSVGTAFRTIFDGASHLVGGVRTGLSQSGTVGEPGSHDSPEVIRIGNTVAPGEEIQERSKPEVLRLGGLRRDNVQNLPPA